MMMFHKAPQRRTSGNADMKRWQAPQARNPNFGRGGQEGELNPNWHGKP